MKKKLILRAIFSIAALSLNLIGSIAWAASGNITGVTQRPWLIDDRGALKSETELSIDNTGGAAFDGWVKITVAGHDDYIEAVGNLAPGQQSRVVHVLELKSDGDNVAFALYDNAAGTGTALNVKTISQKKIRHWRLYVGHNSHLDIGYTHYQEQLKTAVWPGFWDKALLKDMPASDAWQPNDKVHLEVEGVYQLETALAVRSADWFETLKARLKQGRFAYGAAFANNAHSNWGAEELARSAYYAERFMKDRTGVGSTQNIIMRDEPTMSWGMIDAMVEVGAKSFSIHHNADHNPWNGTSVYPELFYAQGKNPSNKLLVWNSPVGNYCVDELNLRGHDLSDVMARMTKKLMRYQSDPRYPYDAAMVNFTNGSDNGPMLTEVYANIKALNDKGYVYPRIINANYNSFFDDIAANGTNSIPAYKGTIEDWWNFGAASTAYETALNRRNKDTLSSAEFLSTVASAAIPTLRYPYERLASAYENLLLYDEHTWGSPHPAVDEQWRWKRNTAIASDLAATSVLQNSMAALNALIPSTGKTLVVYNTLPWSRSDVVTVSQADLPAHLDLIDLDTKKAIAYQRLDDGILQFVAPDVVGLGYKTFRVSPRSDEPVFPNTMQATDSTLENNFFKVAFNTAGNITSILDKQNGGIEMVDPSAPFPLNQYVIYKESSLVGQVTTANVTTCSGAVQVCMRAAGTTTGMDSLTRTVVLYDALPRIDIINEAVKGRQLSNVEMGYFCFPLKVDNFMLRHEMPTGDMRPGVNPDINNQESEQYFSSSTSFYTVNKWIDASNQRDWGITFASLSAPLVSYGKPELGWSKGDWKTEYNTTTPWIYSMAFNNEWQTNFQKTQPGRVVFRYALQGHAGKNWQDGNADVFGAEVASPLKVALIAETQAGQGLDGVKGQFIGIDKKNVVLTTAKMAEANGEGLILRFNEIKGQPTTVAVDLSWFAPLSVMETDLIENDKTPLALMAGKVTFDISAFGFKTLRLTRGTPPGAVSGLAALFNESGCQITWSDQPNGAFFEIFRGTNQSFTAGSGTHIATVNANHYYDQAVRSGLTRTYYYRVRAAGAGRKSAFSTPVQAVSGTLTDNEPPSAPILSGEALHPTKVALTWSPATDNLAVKGYHVFRGASQIADIASVFNSWLDTPVTPGKPYSYTVQAYDMAGNLSEPSNSVALDMPHQDPLKPGNIASEATPSASSEHSVAFSVINVTDENIALHENGEWASKGEKNPWLKLVWPTPQSVRKIIIYDRPNKADDANSGTLSFSDGSTLEVSGIPLDGSPKELTFPPKSITWVTFQVTGGTGPNVGLSEIEVYVQ